MDDEVSELRLVVTAPDYDDALAFYRDTLGLREQAAFSSPDGRVTILAAGRATLELSDPGNAAFIDEVEVGRRVAGPIRVAFEVTDTAADDRPAGPRRRTGRGTADPDAVVDGERAARRARPGCTSRCSATRRASPPRRGEDEIMVGRVGAPDRIDAPVLLVEADPSWPGLAAALVADIDGALGDRAAAARARRLHVGPGPRREAGHRPGARPCATPPTRRRTSAALEQLGYQLRVREPEWRRAPAAQADRAGGQPARLRPRLPRDRPDARLPRPPARRPATTASSTSAPSAGWPGSTWEFVQQYADAKSAVVEQIIAPGPARGLRRTGARTCCVADGRRPEAAGSRRRSRCSGPAAARRRPRWPPATRSPVTTAAAEAVTLAVAAAAPAARSCSAPGTATSLRAALPGRLVDVPDLPGDAGRGADGARRPPAGARPQADRRAATSSRRCGRGCVATSTAGGTATQHDQPRPSGSPSGTSGGDRRGWPPWPARWAPRCAR